MELHQLRYFCAVVKAGNFTRAAKLEGITQPSLSQQIHKLEESVGTELFHRLGRTIQRTQAGNAFYPFARSIIDQSKRAEARMRHLRNDESGPLRVGVIPTLTPYLLAPRLHDFQRLYPKIQVTLVEDLTEKLAERLVASDLDMIVASLPLKQQGIVCSEFLRDPLVLVTPREHPLAAQLHATSADLVGERLLLLKEGHCFREKMLTVCKGAASELSPVFESDNFVSIFALVAAGIGITIAPMMAVAHLHDCCVVPLATPQFRRIGFARLKIADQFKPLVAFSSWLRNVGNDLMH